MPVTIKTAAPQIETAPGTRLTVDAGDPSAVVTQLVIHGYQEDLTEPLDPGPLGGAYFAGDELTT